ncbi:MAG: DUF1641 domain-containing protein, partial [Ferroplasma sp.]
SLNKILDDEMINSVGSLANSFLGLISLAGSAELMNSLERATDSITSGELGKDIHATGAMSLLKQLKDPDVQRGLAPVIGLLKALGKE